MDNSNEIQEVEELKGQEQSPETNTGQENIPERYNDLLSEISDDDVKENTKENTKEDVKEDTEKSDDKTEDKKEEEISDEEVIYENDKIIFKGKDGTKELEKIEINGEFVFAPTTLKDGYLRQADYTKKTMALSDERKTLQTEREQVESLKNQAFALKYVDELGGLEEQPLEKDYLNPDGKHYYKFDSEESAEKAFKEDSKRWNDKAKLEIVIEQNNEQNMRMIKSFVDKYGEEEYSKIAEKAKEYINPFIFKNVVPYPQDALEVLRKGINYDKDLKEAVEKAKIDALKSFNEKGKSQKQTILKSTHNPTPKVINENIPDRWAKVLNEIKT